MTNISITFTGTDDATAESLITAWHRDGEGKEWTLHGRYIDTWHKGMEGWKIVTREIVAAGASACGGRGGGKPNMGQGRGAEGSDAAAALNAMATLLGVKPVSPS